MSSACDHIPIEYKRFEFQNVLKMAKVATKKTFSTEAFEDTQAHWRLFEVEGGGKALPVAGSKVMNIILMRSILAQKRVHICR